MRLTNFLKQINEIFLEICWCHWRRLGVYSSGPVNVCSTDPEALVLLTCISGEKEERLLEIMGQWMRFYGHLIPIDRFKSLLNKTFPYTPPYEHAAVLKVMLTAALPEGEKKRWNPIFEIAESESKNFSLSLKQARIESRKKLDDHEKILTQNKQMAFRYLFGPGSRADICYLISVISRQKQNPFHLRISAPGFAKKLHYNRTSLYRIFVDLEEGLFLRKTGESGKEESSNYELEKERWFLLPEKTTDKAYVDWFQIVVMALQWRELEKNLARMDLPSPEDNPIVKVWLFKTWGAFQDLGRKAFIPAEYPSLIKTELESVSLESIMIGIEKSLEFNLRYLTSR